MDFGQKVALKTVDFLVDFFGGFLPACFPKENGPKKSTKKSTKNPPPKKPNTQIHQKFQGRGVLEINSKTVMLGSGFGRKFFFFDFYFEPPDFVADFVARFVSSFLWAIVPRKILQENPCKILQKMCTTKVPNTFLQRGRAKLCHVTVLYSKFSLTHK